MSKRRGRVYLYVVLAFFIAGNVVLWGSVRDIQPRWQNVPPAITKQEALSFSLNDAQLSYRMIGMMLQHMGDHGGRSPPLKEYDYHALTHWFERQHELDPRSDFTPFLAAYYFGSLEGSENLRPLLTYLKNAGEADYPQKWRWLAQAVFLAQYHLQDKDLALALAENLSQLPAPDMPAWARAMPAFVLRDMGKDQASFALILQLLESGANTLHPNEIMYLRDYACDHFLAADTQNPHPLCE